MLEQRFHYRDIVVLLYFSFPVARTDSRSKNCPTFPVMFSIAASQYNILAVIEPLRTWWMYTFDIGEGGEKLPGPRSKSAPSCNHNADFCARPVR